MRPISAPWTQTITLPAEAGEPAGSSRGSGVDDVPAASIALGAVALGCALQVNFGQYHPLALAWLTVALGSVLLCVAKPGSRVIRFIESRRTTVLGFALAVQFLLLLVHSPGVTGDLAGSGGLTHFRCGILVAAVVTALGLFARGGWRAAALAVLLIVHALLGAWVLAAAPAPGVDVCLFQRDGADALLRGKNPYAITFEDPYADSSRFYGPGVSRDGRLQFGFPYPPLSLLLITPAHALGDFRYAQLMAMTLAGALVAMARPGRLAFAAAALLLFTPRGFFVLEAGWTEPFAVLFLAMTVFAACRSKGGSALPVGLLIATKQYLVLGLLATPLLREREVPGVLWAMRWWVPVAVAAGVVTLPLALWDLPAFVHSTVLLQFRQPFRADALSYLVPLARSLGTPPPAGIGFVLAILAGIGTVRRLGRTPAGFSLAVALLFFLFFAFNKQAFCNYYYFVIGALCSAAGACSHTPPARA